MRWLILPVLLSGCAVQTPVLDQLDDQLNAALGQPFAPVAQRLGDPVVVERDGDLIRHGWRRPDLVKPCEIELWRDEAGTVKRAAWSGYDRSCQGLLDRLQAN